LWLSLIEANEPNIIKYCFRLFAQNPRLTPTSNKDGIDYHRLFASMLTGRSWTVISNSNLATLRTEVEVDDVQDKVSSGKFFIAISEVLAAVPRELLLLLKTNDLLRAIDEALEVGVGSQDHMVKMISKMGWYCAKAVRDDARSQRNGLLTYDYWCAEVEYYRVGLRLVLINLYSMVM